MQVRPRGGVGEVGRSCLHVEAGPHDVLVDCGIKQSHVTEYPDFSGLDTGEVDAVFCTHAHVDHIGALPVAEARGLLAEDAPVIATRPTDALAAVMLWDSLKLHRMEADERGVPPQYDEADVEAVLDRIEGVPYGQHTYRDVGYEFGSAGHLLGSAWLALEHEGARLLVSGDLGGRSGHLPDIAAPPTADALFLESTYGDTLTHPSFTDARTEVFETAVSAASDGVPVLVPSFGMGRAQELLQVFREREPQIPDDVTLVYDGLMEDSMNVYHAFASDPWVNDAVVNYKVNSGDTTPFLPECASKPASMDDREALLDGDRTPIIVAPSGMLTGGWSPFYLWKLTERCADARVLFVGYQAAGTPGRALLEEPGDVATVTVSALMYPEEADRPTEAILADRRPDADPAAYDGQDNDLYDFYEKSIEVPTAWVREVGGLSGHAAANTLLQFARDAGAPQVHLVHGDPAVGEQLAAHLEGNVDAETVRVAEAMETVSVSASGAGDSLRAELDEIRAERERLADDLEALDDRIAALENRVERE